MLQGEMPFGSWRESELDTFPKIAKGQLTLPQTLNPEAVDLITKVLKHFHVFSTVVVLSVFPSLFSYLEIFVQLLEVDESTRLGSQGAHSVKTHPWFHGVDWEGVTNGSFPVPHEITSRIAQHLETHSEDFGASPSPNPYVEQLNTPEWLEDW